MSTAPAAGVTAGVDPFAQRRAGILLHPTSLPARHGIGDLGPSARTFVEWLTGAGMSLWQMLPLVPTDPGLSPYTGWSALAGNPWLISLDDLADDGILSRDEIAAPTSVRLDGIDRIQVAAMRAHKGPLLQTAAERILAEDRAAVDAWRASEGWVEDAVLFDVLRRQTGRPWVEWDAGLRLRDPDALAAARRDLAADVDAGVTLQMVFARQLDRLRRHCHRQGVALIGDVPIYVAPDSADTWLFRHLFQLEAGSGQLRALAGVPPDYFSPTGQLWGNPLYDWDAVARDDFGWWVARLRRVLSQADAVRIDHFRGLSAYWEVPADSEDARTGRWRPGPGRAFFDAIRAQLGDFPIIAEDLGDIDDDVRTLLADTGLPGMRVLEFAFGSGPQNIHLPHNHPQRAVVYTATHDNQTLLGWWRSAQEWERHRVRRYLAVDGHDIVWDLIRTAFASVARTAIVPMQDVLALGDGARMNTPATIAGNWEWRLRKEHVIDHLATRLRDLAALYDRLPAS